MSQNQAKNWKVGAFAAIAGHYKLLEEKASWEERVAASKAECVRLGIDFRWDDEPSVPSCAKAMICPCGAIVPLSYDVERLPRGPDGVLHCTPCRVKTQEAQDEDAEQESPPKATAKPATPPAAEDIPF